MFSTFVKVAKAYRGGASEVTSSNNRMCGVARGARAARRPASSVYAAL